MNKQEKIDFVIKTLQELYPEIPIPLDHKDPYTLLIAVLLSAQCTDVRVNQITPLLFAKADNPFDMVKMTVEEGLEELPAVGHKTASVVMSQAFGVPAFPVDTHIHRLMFRWNLTNGKNVNQTEKDAKRLFPKELWNDLHLQIIWYGREYSPARGWDLEKDIITKTIGRKKVINEYYKK